MKITVAMMTNERRQLAAWRRMRERTNATQTPISHFSNDLYDLYTLGLPKIATLNSTTDTPSDKYCQFICVWNRRTARLQTLNKSFCCNRRSLSVHSNCTADDKLLVCNAIEAEQQDEKTKMIDMHYEGSEQKENVPHTLANHMLQLQLFAFVFFSLFLRLLSCHILTFDRSNERTSSNHLCLSVECVLYRNVCDMAIAASVSVSNCTQSIQFLIAQLRWCALSYIHRWRWRRFSVKVYRTTAHICAFAIVQQRQQQQQLLMLWLLLLEAHSKNCKQKRNGIAITVRSEKWSQHNKRSAKCDAMREMEEKSHDLLPIKIMCSKIDDCNNT